MAVENGYEGTVLDWLKSLNGADGITPHIGANGNWYIGDTDTGQPSRGDKGATGNTGAQGEQGEKGDPGEKGEKGDKGDKGDPGGTGEQGERGESGVYILSEGETIEDAPEDADVVIDPNGEADFDPEEYAKTEDMPTDEHINQLIAAALAAIPDASEVAY